MKYYKHKTTNEIFAYESDGSQDHIITSDLEAITQEELDGLQAPTPEQLKQQAKVEALAAYEKAIEALIGKVPNTELSSWAKQEAEARALLLDSTAETPMLTQLVVSREANETILELATKVVANADAYAVAYAKVLGEYQAQLRLIG